MNAQWLYFYCRASAWLTAAILAATMSAYAQTPDPQNPQPDKPAINLQALPNRAAMVRNPQTAQEFFANLKLAFDNNWLLKTEFYEDEQLKVFFGATDVVKIVETPPRVSINSVSNGRELRPIDAQLTRSLSFFDRTDATIRGGMRTILPTQKFNSSFGVNFRDRTVPVDLALATFGKEWKLVRPRVAPSGHRITGAVTHKLGLDHLTYDLSNDKLLRQIEIYTNENGSISNIRFIEEEKQS